MDQFNPFNKQRPMPALGIPYDYLPTETPEAVDYDQYRYKPNMWSSIGDIALAYGGDYQDQSQRTQAVNQVLQNQTNQAAQGRMSNFQIDRAERTDQKTAQDDILVRQARMAELKKAQLEIEKQQRINDWQTGATSQKLPAIPNAGIVSPSLLPQAGQQQDPYIAELIRTANSHPDHSVRLAAAKELRAQNKPIAVGKNLVNPNTYKTVYEGEDLGEKEKMADRLFPDDPIAQRAWLLDQHDKSKLLTPEEFAQEMKLKDKWVIGADEDGNPTFIMNGGDMTKKTEGAIEEAQLSAINTLNNLANVGDRYADEYLTYNGKVRAALAVTADKAGIASPKQKKLIEGMTQFGTSVDRMFNAYRKEITGAAASVQELEILKESMINKDMSPTQFKAAYKDFVSIMRSQLELSTQLREKGLSSGEITNKLNEAFANRKNSNVNANVSAGTVIDFSSLPTSKGGK